MASSTGLFLVVGALFIALSVPLMRRRVKPNRFYGLRVGATFADEWVWYEGNSKSGRDLFVLGVGISLMALALPLVPGMTSGREAALLAGLSGVGAVAMAVIGVRRANRLLRNRTAGTGDREASP